jgi:flagellar biosynthesis/type III secretory pathway chaperone
MGDLTQQVTALLVQESGLYRDLLELLHLEKEAAVQLDLDRLQQVGRLKDELTDRLRRLGSQRQEALTELAARLAVPAEAVTLKALAQRLPETHSQHLSQLRTELLTIIQSVQEANKQNRALLAHSIDLMKGSYQLLNRLTAHNPVYARSGSVFSNGSGGRLFSGQA